MKKKNSLEDIARKISEKLETQEKAREKALALHRQVIRAAGQSIRATHRGDFEKARLLLGEARQILEQIHRLLSNFPEVLYAGFTQDAEKEYSEALLTLSFVAGDDLPDPDEIGVDYAAYLNGMAETVGELRRNILDRIREGSDGKSEEFLEKMDEIYFILISMDYADAVTRGLRRSTDVARSILEKTRGDYTLHLENRKLEGSLKKFARQLDSE